MRRFSPILIFISVLTLLFFVSTITILSSYGIPSKKTEFKMSHVKTDEQQKYAMSGATARDE